MSKENNQKNQSHTIHEITSFYFVFLLLVGVPYTSAQFNNGSSPPPNPKDYLLWNFNPSLAIIIIVLVTAFFFIGFFSIYFTQCCREYQTDRSVRQLNPSVGRSRRAGLGLDPAFIQTFPTFIYSDVKGLKIGKGALECAVCISEFEDEETLRLLPKCDHVFHPECIDAWLASHITCPVCRANLTLESDPIKVPDPESESDVENPPSAIENAQEDQVVISVVEDQIVDSQPEVINPALPPIQNRKARSKAARLRISGKFPRSHSTGHSLVQPGENCERFTLRLPEEVRKQIMSGKQNRTTSCVSFPTGDGSVSGGSTRRVYRYGDGSSRGRNYLIRRLEQEGKSDRWMFSKTPPFFSRTSSVRSSKRAEGEGSSLQTHGTSKEVFQILTKMQGIKQIQNVLYLVKWRVPSKSDSENMKRNWMIMVTKGIRSAFQLNDVQMITIEVSVGDKDD